MCESGKQSYERESCGTHVDQLKRQVHVLMIWVFILSLGLGAIVVFHISLLQRPDTTMRTCNCSENMARAQLTTYSIHQNKEMAPEWLKEKEEKAYSEVQIDEDGKYFLFLKVTLQSRKQGVNYTITVTRLTSGISPRVIIKGHINGIEDSTGFMGAGVPLTQFTLINITCSPPAQFDVDNTYLGLIKF